MVKGRPFLKRFFSAFSKYSLCSKETNFIQANWTGSLKKEKGFTFYLFGGVFFGFIQNQRRAIFGIVLKIDSIHTEHSQKLFNFFTQVPLTHKQGRSKKVAKNWTATSAIKKWWFFFQLIVLSNRVGGVNVKSTPTFFFLLEIIHLFFIYSGE